MSELYPIRERFTRGYDMVPLPRKNGMPDCRDDRPCGRWDYNLSCHPAAPERLGAMTGRRPQRNRGFSTPQGGFGRATGW